VKKGQIGLAAVIGSALTLVVLGIVLTVGQDILSTLKSDYTSATYQYNASDDGNQAIDKISNWQKTIGLVIGAGAVITIVVLAFAAVRFRG